jgi:hypothetical protein
MWINRSERGEGSLRAIGRGATKANVAALNWTGRDMGKPRTGRALTNEIKYPYIVELPVDLKESVDLKELDAELSRQIIVFHTSRKIQVRHGRQITKESKIYFRWCFPDLTTAGAFIERFGGAVHKR